MSIAKNSLILFLVLLSSCSPYSIRNFIEPDLVIPDTFHREQDDTEARESTRLFWEAFDNPKLNSMIERALSDNLSLKAAWSRLDQAHAQARIAGSAQYPQINVTPGISRTRLEGGRSIQFGGGPQQTVAYETNYLVRNGLSFEVDLWRRLANSASASDFRLQARKFDVEGTALVLAGTITELWLQAEEQQGLLNVLKGQVSLSEDLLELTELRFAVGSGSALDVYQQRQQLAATRAEVPIANSVLEQLQNQLAVLVGVAPGDDSIPIPDGALPELPEFPKLIQPIQLLSTRPDVQSVLGNLQGAEYDIAVAVADRFPRLTLGINYEFSTDTTSSLFSREIGSASGELLTPLVDGGRRRAEVERRESITEELLNSFSETYLMALREVEDALSKEKYQKQLIEQVELQYRYAQATLRESQSRYINGLSDYLQVIVAIQDVQRLERRRISEKRSLLVTRAELYRALGGKWTSDLDRSGSINTEEVL